MQFQKAVVVTINGKQQEMRADRCMADILQANKVDLKWDNESAVLSISPSKEKYISHEFQANRQLLKGVYFHHGAKCPLQWQGITLNPQRKMKPCAVTMLMNEKSNEVLVTKRSEKLFAFPGAWVLPGGHLQEKQSIIEGGLRQCEQEVGLPKNTAKYDMKWPVMAWESVFQIDNKVKASALVIFFTAICEKFDVKPMEKEVSQFKWKNLEDNSDEKQYIVNEVQGYGEAHLKYLGLCREHQAQKFKKQ